MTKPSIVLGVSAFYHDSAATIVRDGHIIAAAQEERFSRIKHDASFPTQAIMSCVDAAGVTLADVTHVTFYDKPFIKFERLLETYFSYAPRGFRSFLAAMPIWLKEKLFLKTVIRRELSALSQLPEKALPPLLFGEHHHSHAASAFYPCPFEEAAVLCMDGVGEWATTSVWVGKGNTLVPQWEIHFPHSLGLLYSAFTQYAGFKVNSGEYKLMGLAPYGSPRYVSQIYEELIDVKPDGTFRLNLDYFDFPAGLRMINQRFCKLFGGPAREPESEITQKEMDIAASIQVVTEEIVLKLARTIASELGQTRLCLAGGVALNCVANGRLLREGPFEDIWIQPASGDAGGALGAALATHYEYLGNHRAPSEQDPMRGAYLGPRFSNDAIATALDDLKAVYTQHDDDTLLPLVAKEISEGQVIGWFSDAMEFGPRALGARSILADPRSPHMQTTLNLKVKQRESFRPFAPAVLKERATDWFELESESPYMMLVATVANHQRTTTPADQAAFGIDLLKQTRSTIPAVTHVDYSARVQTVDADTNPRFHHLLSEFEAITGCPVLINTSFNVRGEPIVYRPEDAYHCFMNTGIDRLVIGSYLLKKEDQPSTNVQARQFELD
jgi:carbamoyltransferase